MDPVANLREQLELARAIATESAYVTEPADLDRLAELVLALDEWRRKGGFDPYATEPERYSAAGILLGRALDSGQLRNTDIGGQIERFLGRD